MGSMESNSKLLVLLGASGLALAAGVSFWIKYQDKKESEGVEYDWHPDLNENSRTRLKINITPDDVGVLFGREGYNIRQIEYRTNTSIQLLDNESNDVRTLLIRGLKSNVLLAEINVCQVIINFPKFHTCAFEIPNTDKPLILIAGHKSTITCNPLEFVVGRDGGCLKTISLQSHCKIDIVSSADGEISKSCSVLLQGTSYQIEMAKYLILDRVETEIKLKNEIRNTAVKRSPRLKRKQKKLFLTADTNTTETPNKVEFSTYKKIGLEKMEGYMEVYVSTVVDPSQFYVQIVGSDSVKLDKLICKMTEYYENKDKLYLPHLSEDKIAIGDIVATKLEFDGNWYRCEVLKIMNDEYDPSLSQLELIFVDFGDRIVVRLSDVFDIKTDFLKLHFQALKCSLFKAHPNNSTEWTPEAIEHFENITYCGNWKVLSGKVMDISHNTLSMELYDSKSYKLDTNIVEELVKHSYAVVTINN